MCCRGHGFCVIWDEVVLVRVLVGMIFTLVGSTSEVVQGTCLELPLGYAPSEVVSLREGQPW